MIKTITINEAAKMLNYKKVHSAEKWCTENNVIIMAVKGRRKKHIVQLQFEYARLRTFIQYLKQKYPEKWLEAFQAFIEFDIICIVKLEEERLMKNDIRNEQGQKLNSYQPLDYELKILSRLTE